MSWDFLWRPGEYLKRNFLGPVPPGTPARTLAAGVVGSLALFPLVWAQAAAAHRHVPRLPPARPPHHGMFSGVGDPIRVLAIGESTVSGVGLARGDETIAATTARALARVTRRPAAWHAHGLGGATAREGLDRILPRIPREPVDLLVIAFCVNDLAAYRSPARFADDLAAIVTAARDRVGDAAVVIAGVAPIAAFPALPWPLGSILGWRAAAMQAAAEGLTQRLPKLVVERITTPLTRDLFASDGFHPNPKAHAIWGENIAALALPLLA